MGEVIVDDLTVSFGNKLGLDSISFSAEKGKVLTLLGPNGAGKTTVINALIGNVKPLSGTVRLFGLDPIKDHNKLTPLWSVMPQHGGLPIGLTCYETLKLFTKLVDSEYSPDDLLTLVGLTKHAKSRWRKMSGGEQQKLSLAIALASPGYLLMLDEPTAGLDITSRVELLNTIRQKADNGATVILTTHNYSDAENIADDVIILNEGQLITKASVDNLIESKSEITFNTTPGLPITNLVQDLQKWVTETKPGHYVIQGIGDSQTLSTLTNWLEQHNAQVDNLKIGTKSLKEVVFELTEEAKNNDAINLNEANSYEKVS